MAHFAGPWGKGIRISTALACGAVLIGLAGCGSGDSGTITRVSRQNNSGTYVYFREAVLGKEREYKLGSIDQSGSKDVVELVSKTPSAIGYSGMGYATDGVKMLKVCRTKGETPVAPSVENAQDGSYPLARPLQIYMLGEPTGAVKAYLAWIHSDEGQQVVAEIGYVPIDVVPIPEAEQEEADKATEEVVIRVSGSDTMVNLAQAWAEKYHEKHSNVSVQVSGGGSGVGIAALINGTTDLADASRKMKPKEKETAKEKHGGKEVNEFIVALDALGVYVHKDNPINSICLEELAEIYGEGGKITQWSQLS
ncbi:MAG: substrate-binding domain-containing protein, partial [Pirellulales bacterium]